MRKAMGVLVAMALLATLGVGAAQAAPSASAAAPAVADTATIAIPLGPVSSMQNLPIVATWTPPGGRGSDVWYGTAFYGSTYYTVMYVRYSWSQMWYIKNSMTSAQTFVTSLCGFVAAANKVAGAACVSLVNGAYWAIRDMVNYAIATKRCIRLRIPAPPKVSYATFQRTYVTCRL